MVLQEMGVAFLFSMLGRIEFAVVTISVKKIGRLTLLGWVHTIELRCGRHGGIVQHLRPPATLFPTHQSKLYINCTLGTIFSLQ
jgi:hypothetical protein